MSFDKVKEFQDKTKFKVGSLDLCNTDRIDQRIKLIAEEVQELFASLGYSSELKVTIGYHEVYNEFFPYESIIAENVLKEACDVGVVVEGTIAEFGWDYDHARQIVDDNNLTKVQEGAVYVDGKLQKPEGYKKPDLSELV